MTFSRCAADPVTAVLYESVPGYASPNGLPRQSLARDCSLRVLDLTSGSERALPVPRAPGVSDATPSMWRGDVAFARLSHGARVAQVLLWHHRDRRIVRLRHGDVPTSCPYRAGCAGMKRRGEVQQLDLGAGAVAFVWDVSAPAVVGAGDGWELRVDDLPSGVSRRYGSGYQSGACGAGYPLSPTVAGRDVWFDQLHWACDGPTPPTSTAPAVAPACWRRDRR